METRASYLLVGSFVLLIFLGIVFFVIWLGKFQFDKAYTRYDIVVAGSVSGLKIGSSVELNGIPVGEVTKIELDPDNVERVHVIIEVPASTPIKTDTKAILQITGITGGLKIQLSGGTQEAPPLEPKPGEDRAMIVARSSTLEEFLDGAPALLEDVQVLIRRTSSLLSPENTASFTRTMENFAILTGALAQRSDDINSLITDAATTMDNVRAMSVALKELSSTLSTSAQELTRNANNALISFGGASASVRDTVQDNRPQIDTLFDQFSNTGASLARTSNQLDAMVAENRGPVRDFTQEGLYQLTDLIVQTRGVLENLRRVTAEVQRDPARFLFGNQQQGYEAGGGDGR